MPLKKLITLIIFQFICISAFSQNQNISNGFVFDGEPYIAVDPQNNQHIVVAWLGYKLNEIIVIKTKVSNDGGNSWSPIVSIPHITTGNQSADPSLQFDHLGNVYLAYIDYNSTTFSNGAVYVVKSTDGGLTWGTPSEVISINDCPNKYCIDRPWMQIDRTTGPNQGTIYVTSMNADQNVSPPYNPYLAVSNDGGTSFNNPRYLDTINFLSGDAIPQPMPSPSIGADGTFYAAYPSYVTSQSLFATTILGNSIDGGNTLNHSIIQYGGVGSSVSDIYAKKGSLFFTDESDPNHLALIILAEYNGDADVFYSESYDKGVNWSALERVNQDGISNGILQDLIWADFNSDGDLVVTWRDRRNSGNAGYNQPTEIYAAIRMKDSTTFKELVLSDQIVQFDTILNESGNDFMCSELVGDTLYAVWGDVRTSKLNIFMSKTNINTAYSNVSTILEKKFISVYPNPTSNQIYLKGIENNTPFNIINSKGKMVLKGNYQNSIDVSNFSKGYYFIVVDDSNIIKFIIE